MVREIEMEQENKQVTGGLWRQSLLRLSLLLVLLFAFYYETLLSMVSVWWRSETFAHGFFIFPISLYLIWEKKAEIIRLSPTTDVRALLLLGLSGFGWLLANIVDVQVVQQLSLVGMIPLMVWAILGWPVTRLLLFPLGFLFFAVPIGEFLVPPMMNFTADFTVGMIELTGIPVYREGTFFSIPSGDWSVVEGCSGLRYLIASITLGTLYAYMTYRSNYRRVAFIILAIIFPIIANGLRAFMIVMIAHHSNMKLALGVDHYIYGWVFFGLVIFLMFWIGSFWREESEGGQEVTKADVSSVPSNGKKQLIVAALALFVSVIWPLSAALMVEKEVTQVRAVQFDAPAVKNSWQKSAGRLTDWKPSYTGQQLEVDSLYSLEGEKVAFYLRYYRDQKQGSELINSQNVLIPQKHPVWKMLDQYPIRVTVGEKEITVKRSRLSSQNKKLLVWHWNWVSGQHASNNYIAKLLEAKDKLLGRASDAAGIILVVEYDESTVEAERRLQVFINALFPGLNKSLEAASKLS
jgi:exosortase A